MPRIPPFHLLVAFDAVSRLGSITKAAESLHLTASAVSHRLAKLEQILDVRLCERTRDGMRLTREGKTYSASLSGALEGMIELSKCLVSPGNNNSLSIQAGPGFSRLWLMPRLADLQKACPDISLEINASFETVDFDAESVDLWVNRNHVQSDSLWIEKIFDEQFVPLASPSYLKKNPIKEFSDLLDAPLIYCTRNQPNWTDWFNRFQLQAPQQDWSLAMNHAGNTMQAASQGLGVVLESLQLSETHRKSKRLVEVFPREAAIEGPGQYLICPPKHLEHPAVQCFLSWLRSQTAQEKMRI